MAELYEGIYAELIADSSISSKVKQGSWYNVYQNEIPENYINSGTAGSRYFIRINKITAGKIIEVDVETPLYQIDAIADTLPHAIDLKNDIVSVFERYKGTLQGKRSVWSVYTNGGGPELKDPDTNYYYIPIEIKFNYFGDNI